MKKCKEELSRLRHERASSAGLPAAVAVLGSAFLAATLFGCPARDPGFDLVRVPASAYLPFDGGPDALGADGGDAGRVDAAPATAVQCFPVPDQDDGDFEPSEDFADCPATHLTDALDPRITQQHRDKGEAVCCYRKGGRTHVKDGPIFEE